jgi:hypothetical protein
VTQDCRRVTADGIDKKYFTIKQKNHRRQFVNVYAADIPSGEQTILRTWKKLR